MKNNAVKDMTFGSPPKLILGFFVPMVFGLLFQQLYNMVDTIIVGKYLGVGALASVGSTGSINFMVIGFCIGVCNGFAIPIAQKFGEKNFVQLKKFAANAAWLAIGFSLAMTLAVCLLCRQILTWMNTPEDIMDGAYRYIFVIFLGIPATYLYNMVSGVIRSLGDSRTPLYFLILSSLLNVALDLFTIVGLGMGVDGAAWATVLSQAASGIACLAYMKKRFEILRMTKEEAAFDWQMAKILCGIGIPMGLQYSITAIGSIILQVAVNGLGSLSVAAMTAATKIGMFFCCPFDALGSTMATYGGQNIGAKKTGPDRRGFKGGDMDGHGLLFAGLGRVVRLRGQNRPFIPGFRRKGNLGDGKAVFAGQRYLLYPVGAGQCSPFPDSRNGVFQAGRAGRRMRDGCPGCCGFFAGTLFRVSCRLLCQPLRLDCRGFVPNPFLFVHYEAALPKAGYIAVKSRPSGEVGTPVA